MRLSIIFKHIFKKETLWALALVFILLAVIIATTDTSPIWIYQGF